MSKYFKVTSLEKIGDRDDYLVTLDRDRIFPLSISGTQQAIFDSKGAADPYKLFSFLDDQIAKNPSLYTKIINGNGLTLTSYNSPGTIDATVAKIQSEGIDDFLVNKLDSSILGDNKLEIIVGLKDKIRRKYEFDFINPIDPPNNSRFEFKEPVKDFPDFLYNILTLAWLTDQFTIKQIKFNDQEIQPIKKFEIWLSFTLKDVDRAAKLVKPISMIRKLRNQYPVHEHLDLLTGVEAKSLKTGEKFYGIDKNTLTYDEKWQKVKTKFLDAFTEIAKALFE